MSLDFLPQILNCRWVVKGKQRLFLSCILLRLFHQHIHFIITNFNNPCLFHYKSLVIFYCFTWFFSLAEVKANSAVLLKKRLWLNYHFMTLLFTATQTQLYRTKDFHGLKFAANLQHALFFRIFQVSKKRTWSARGLPLRPCLVLKRVDHSPESCWTTVFFQVILLLLVTS